LSRSYIVSPTLGSKLSGVKAPVIIEPWVAVEVRTSIEMSKVPVVSSFFIILVLRWVLKIYFAS
jgi:hypothetical protein